MELTVVPGIGPAYRERLEHSGVRNVDDLAAAEDLDRLHAQTGIPRSRLEVFRDDARSLLAALPDEAEPDLGIATEGISHEMGETAARAGETMRHAWDDARALAQAKWMDVRAWAEGLADKLPKRRGANGHA